MFASKYATLLWDKLYNVQIPDHLTLNEQSLRVFGTYSSGNKEVDEMMSDNYTNVMIPVVDMVVYFNQGLGVLINRREDMIEIYDNIQGYLEEWRNHAKYDINNSLEQNRKMLSDFDNVAKKIHSKLRNTEFLPTFGTGSPGTPNLFGIQDALTSALEVKKATSDDNRPDYTGINDLLKRKTTGNRGSSVFSKGNKNNGGNNNEGGGGMSRF